jgi:maltose alpha-D-glucosyltransferase/alpha-amylase
MISANLWYKNAVFYQVYVRAFFDSNADGHGDLRGLTLKLDYLQDLGIDCLWIMPVYPSPLLDDGYDIADFYDIHPDYGTLRDFKDFIEAAHQRGMRVITDLVLNHTSDKHPWFQAARSDPRSNYRDYYVWSDNDQKYQKARIIFLDTEKSNWTWNEQASQYYWRRFYASQPDLNYDNPAVQDEMMQVMEFWLDLGVDGFRADAVPYLFEREGTVCENLPETHAYLKKLRRLIDEKFPDRILLCEANQWPEDVREYFGEDDEFHMGFHFPLMPRIFKALGEGDVAPIHWILKRTPPIPEGNQWCTFLRNHDELTLEMVTEEERQWMWEQYAPEPRMRLNLGIRRRLSPLLGNDQRKIELAYSLLFTLPGSPIIYYGDEIGMGDNIWLDDRNGVRTPMQWDDSNNGGFSNASPDQLYAPIIANPDYNPERVSVARQRGDPASLLNTIKAMVNVRKSHPAFGWGDFSWALDDSTSGSGPIAAYWRTHGDEKLLIIHNLTSIKQTIEITLPSYKSDDVQEIFGNASAIRVTEGRLSAEIYPYQYQWLQLRS